MLFEQWTVGPMANFVYVFGQPGGEVVLVDPAFEVDAVLDRIESAGCRVTDVLATHGHPDHIQGIPQVQEQTGARVLAHVDSRIKPDVRLKDGERLVLAGVPVEVIHTPGHIEDAVCYIVNGTHLLTGDTLFVGECGRVDLPGADPAKLYDSLLRVLAALPGDLIVCPGHDYGKTPTSTLAHERATNYVLKPRTLEQFLAFMAEP